MLISRALVLVALLVLTSGNSPSAKTVTCSPQAASDRIPYKNEKAGNKGVVPTGFIALNGKGEALHGIDVSKYQDNVDFERLKLCDASFSYVRLSAGSSPDNELTYRDLWKNAKSVGLLTGGYHNMRLADPKNAYTLMNDHEKDAFINSNIENAREQAGLFMTRLNEVLLLDPKAEVAPGKVGSPYLPAVLDLTWQPQAAFGAENIKAFSSGYRRGICAWVEAFQSDARFLKQPVILFTTAQNFIDYGFGQLTCVDQSQKWWISYHTRTGGSFYENKDEVRGVSEMCGEQVGPGRCVFQQYTSFGGFALFKHDSAMDLDRFFGSRDQLQLLLQSALAPVK